ncbi:MAG: CheR family methyltransferase [Thermoguttaceae bacterium]
MTAAPADEILSDVFELLRRQAGVNPESLGVAGIAHAVGRRIAASGAGSPQDYLRRILADRAEFQQLLEDLVVPETWFFRDMLAFRQVMEFLEARRASGLRSVRALSVGCSTGEEVYSLAMLLRGAGWRASEFRVVGADIHRKSLERAREGTFGPPSFRELDQVALAFRERWCEPLGDSWRVGDELRSSVEFQIANLAHSDFLGQEAPFQVVFCRNVLIYFHEQARHEAVRSLRRLLAPDGLLCSAPAEARIFSEAGLQRSAGECPFAFRHPDVLCRRRGTLAPTCRSAGAAGPIACGAAVSCRLGPFKPAARSRSRPSRNGWCRRPEPSGGIVGRRFHSPRAALRRAGRGR